MNDEQTIDAVVKVVPGAIKNHMVTKFADELRPIIRAVILDERERAAKVALSVVQDGQQIAKQAAASGDQRLLVVADSAMRTARGIATLIRAAPGACTTCRGTHEVQSTLAPGMMVRCPDCPPPKVAEPAVALEVVATNT